IPNSECWSWIATKTPCRRPIGRGPTGVIRADSHGCQSFRDCIVHKAVLLDQRSDVLEQFLAVGWVGDRMYSVIFEVREDEEGEILHLVTPWKSTTEEIRLHEENS